MFGIFLPKTRKTLKQKGWAINTDHSTINHFIPYSLKGYNLIRFMEYPGFVHPLCTKQNHLNSNRYQASAPAYLIFTSPVTKFEV